MPSFQFLATLTVDAPSEADAQTKADIAIADADQYLGEDYRLTRDTFDAETVWEEIRDMPRYTVELTTEGWQIKGPDGKIGGDVYASRRAAQQEADAANAL